VLGARVGMRFRSVPRHCPGVITPTLAMRLVTIATGAVTAIGSVSPRADKYNLSCGVEYADHAACRMLIAVRDRERMCSRR
jgi:hypothetical protein